MTDRRQEYYPGTDPLVAASQLSALRRTFPSKTSRPVSTRTFAPIMREGSPTSGSAARPVTHGALPNTEDHAKFHAANRAERPKMPQFLFDAFL